MLQKIIIWTVILVVASGLPALLKSDREGRIIGGKVVPIEKFPFQVSVQYNGYHNCGGSIITEDMVLTAGHCASSGLTVRAGSNYTTKGGTTHKVILVLRHENFSVSFVPKNDIALLKVSPAFKFDKTRAPIKLHVSEKNIKDGDIATVSGFGVTDSGSISTKLRAVKVPVVNRDNCSNMYTDLGFGEISEDFICGGTPEGGKDSCQGDSGGPFIVKGQLAGIVSYGYKCAQPNVPGVYTNVPYFDKWIRKNIKPKN